MSNKFHSIDLGNTNVLTNLALAEDAKQGDLVDFDVSNGQLKISTGIGGNEKPKLVIIGNEAYGQNFSPKKIDGANSGQHLYKAGERPAIKIIKTGDSINLFYKNGGALNPGDFLSIDSGGVKKRTGGAFNMVYPMGEPPVTTTGVFIPVLIVF